MMPGHSRSSRPAGGPADTNPWRQQIRQDLGQQQKTTPHLLDCQTHLRNRPMRLDYLIHLDLRLHL